MTAPAFAPPAPPRVAAPPATSPRPRFDTPDLLRGLIMVIMLLDHTRDFTHTSALKFDPTDLTQTSVVLFFTRWITHFCAPLFVFLAGMSVAFQQQRGKTPRDLSGFLLKRGIWLCVLELVVIRALVFWRVSPEFFMVQVIWALGISMICLALLIRFPKSLVLLISAVMVLGHNLFDGVQVAQWAGPDSAIPSAAGKFWFFLHQTGAFPMFGWPGPIMYVQYPVVPWIGVMALGWLLGDVYRWDARVRQNMLLKLGVALTAAFVLLRLSNVYGDPSEWTTQASGAFTFLSFLNVTKYPPALLFLLMTIGPGLIALAWFERSGVAGRNAFTRALITFGRVPLFFYILQWMYAKIAGLVLSLIAGRDTAMFTEFAANWTWTEGFGFNLGVTYAAWIVGVFVLYWPCRWFAGVKARRRDWWLSYL